MITKDDLESLGYYEAFNIETKEKELKNPMQMMKEFKELTGQDMNPGLYISLIQEEYEEFLESKTDEECLKELADLAYVCFGFAYNMGWDLTEALQRVHQNNLGRILQPDGTIKRREDGKIIKNPDYPKPDLKDLVSGTKSD